MEPTAKLILHPHRHAFDASSVPALTTLLAEIGLIGRVVMVDGATHYRAGDELFSLVTFLGCAPNIVLEPPAKRPLAPMDFINVSLTGPLAKPHLRTGRNSLAPPCPACGDRRQAWQAAVADHGTLVTCAACGAEIDVAALNWRKSAVVADFFIDLWGIYPAEAVPTPGLMNALAGFSGGPWRHGYLLDEG